MHLPLVWVVDHTYPTDFAKFRPRSTCQSKDRRAGSLKTYLHRFLSKLCTPLAPPRNTLGKNTLHIRTLLLECCRPHPLSFRPRVRGQCCGVSNIAEFLHQHTSQLPDFDRPYLPNRTPYATFDRHNPQTRRIDRLRFRARAALGAQREAVEFLQGKIWQNSQQFWLIFKHWKVVRASV